MAEKWLGKEELYIDKSVQTAKVKLERSIATRRLLKVNEVIREEDLHMLSPGDGYRWSQLSEVIGKRVARDIPANEIIYPEDIQK